MGAEVEAMSRMFALGEQQNSFTGFYLMQWIELLSLPLVSGDRPQLTKPTTWCHNKKESIEQHGPVSGASNFRDTYLRRCIQDP